MPTKLWKVHGRLKLRNPGTQVYQYADLDETLEEVTTPGAADSPDDVRVFRAKEKHIIHSYIGCGSHAGQIFENLIQQAVERCPKW
jgi:hypothetical protein